MAVIAQSLHTISNVVKHEYGADYAYCRQLVTVNDAAGTLAIGTVLGQVTVGGKRLPFYIAAASKEKEPNIEIIQIDDQYLKEKLYEVEQNTPKIVALKNREIEPIR